MSINIDQSKSPRTGPAPPASLAATATGVTSWLARGRLLRTSLEADDIVLLREGLLGSVTYRNDRAAPGRYSSWRKDAVSGAIGVSTRRLVVWAGRTKHIDLPRMDAFLTALDIGLDRPDRVRFGYDAGRFNPTRSGTVEVRLRIARASRVVELLRPSA